MSILPIPVAWLLLFLGLCCVVTSCLRLEILKKDWVVRLLLSLAGWSLVVLGLLWVAPG